MLEGRDYCPVIREEFITEGEVKSIINIHFMVTFTLDTQKSEVTVLFIHCLVNRDAIIWEKCLAAA